MKPTIGSWAVPAPLRPLLAPVAVGLAGLGFWAALVLLDRAATALSAGLAWLPAAAAGIAAPVLVEEAAKYLLILALSLILPDRAGRTAGRGASTSIVIIAIFSALESLDYLRAFPGGGIFLRLLWSEPVHLVTALALASALVGPGRASKRTAARKALGGLSALPFALAWHLCANLLASGTPGTAAVVAAVALNLIVLAALSRRYFDRLALAGPARGEDPGGWPHG